MSAKISLADRHWHFKMTFVNTYLNVYLVSR